MTTFRSTPMQWQALNSAKAALHLIRGIESKLAEIVNQKEICFYYPNWTGPMSEEVEKKYNSLMKLHLSKEDATALRKAATFMSSMLNTQEEKGETNTFHQTTKI